MSRSRPCPFGRTVALAFVALVLLGPHTASPQDVRNPWEAQGNQPLHGTFSLFPWEQIDMQTGNAVLRFTDFVLPGISGVDLRVERVFNTNARTWRVGVAGPVCVWLHAATQAGNPFITYHDGAEQVAFRASDGTDAYYTLSYGRLRDSGSGATRDITLETPDGLVWHFNQATSHEDGWLVSSLGDSFGNELLRYEYENGQLRAVNQRVPTVTAANQPGGEINRRVEFQYDNGRVEEVRWNVPANTGWSTRTWTYVWTAAQLTVTPPVGGATIVAWDAVAGSSPLQHTIAVHLPDGGTVTYTTERWKYPFIASALQIGQVDVVRYRHTAGTDIVPGTWTFTYLETAEGEEILTESSVQWPIPVNAPARTDTYSHIKESSSFYSTRVYLSGQSTGGLEATTYTPKPPLTVTPVGLPYRGCGNSSDLTTCHDETALPMLLEWVKTTRSDNPAVEFWTHYEYRPEFYNDYGHPDVITEGGSVTRVTRVSYDHQFAGYIRGRVASVSVDGIGTTRQRTYDVNTGFLEAETVNGVTTNYVPNAIGQVWKQVDESNPAQTTRFGYEAGSQKDVVTAEYGIYRGISADGRVGWEHRGTHNATYFGYDDIGRPTHSAPPAEGHTRWEYTVDSSGKSIINTKRCELNEVDCTLFTVARLDGLNRTGNLGERIR